MSRTIQNVIDSLSRVSGSPLPLPPYTGKNYEPGTRLALAVESMAQHMTDEGWQIMQGLEASGYTLAGYGLPPYTSTDVEEILAHHNPSVVVVQDKREWDVRRGDFREPRAKFIHVENLRERTNVFKLTILKDAQQRPEYHRQSAEEIGCHAWIVYYHPSIVARLAPYVRPEHMIRTYHSLDSRLVPSYSADRNNITSVRRGCLISGAVSGAYPLRTSLVNAIALLPETTYLPHPGYHRNGCATPEFLKTLSRFKVAICTSSMYGYLLRKIIEATACGCIVVTDLPTDEVVPEIDGNLVRVSPDIKPLEMGQLLKDLYAGYDTSRQVEYARMARGYFDWRTSGIRLAQDIEAMRLSMVRRQQHARPATYT